MLKGTDNNKAATFLTCFLETVSTNGLPSRIRTDKGLEKVNIVGYMISRRGLDRGSAITGESTHNHELNGNGEMSIKEY